MSDGWNVVAFLSFLKTSLKGEVAAQKNDKCCCIVADEQEDLHVTLLGKLLEALQAFAASDDPLLEGMENVVSKK